MKKLTDPLVLLSVIFGISRVLAHQAGLRFDSLSVTKAIQLIDPTLMQDHLWQSVFYLHSQPPLFNLFVGLIVKYGGERSNTVFALLYLLNSYLLGTGFYVLLRRLRIGERLACGLAIYLILNPAVLLLENWLMYTAFLMTGLCWAGVYLHRYAEEGRIIDGAIFFGILVVLALTKGIFHWFWLGMVVVILLMLVKKLRRRTWAVGGLAFLIVCSVYAKNWMIFGKFSIGRMWMVTNLSEMVTKEIPRSDLIRLVRKGEIGFFASAETFADTKKHRPQLIAAHRAEIEAQVDTTIPVLSQKVKPTSQTVSWHSLYQYRLADEYWRNSLYLVRKYPRAFGRSLWRTYLISFFPAPTDVTFVNRQRLQPYENVYNIMFAHLNGLNNGELYSDRLLLWYRFRSMRWDGMSIFLYSLVVVFYGLLFFGGCGWLIRALRKGRDDPATLVSLAFMLFTIAFVIAGSNVFAWIGSNRYRFVLEPYFLALFALAVQRIFKGRQMKGA